MFPSLPCTPTAGRATAPALWTQGRPDQAEDLYNYIVEACRQAVDVVETGEFGAEMKVSLLNDGPFTIILDEAIL